MDGFNRGEGITDTTNRHNVHPKYTDKHAETHEVSLHQQPGTDLRTSANLYQTANDNLNKKMTEKLRRDLTQDWAGEVLPFFWS